MFENSPTYSPDQLDSRLESQLRQWAKPPGQTEKDKCERAVRMIQKAINNDPKLQSMNISIFPKGSFYKRTNIPSDSDVDVGVCYRSNFINDFPEGTTHSDFGFFISSYTFKEFKEDIKRAIMNCFDSTDIELGNKSIKIRSNTSRVDADVVPLFVHRRYNSRTISDYNEGAALRAENGSVIKNWPKQDYDNGVRKNRNTGERYKAMIRVLKHIRNAMKTSGYSEANNIPSFLIECLLWNVPDSYFNSNLYSKDLVSILHYLLQQLPNIDNCKEWGEVNELKYLFRISQPWTRDQAYSFISGCRKYILDKINL